MNERMIALHHLNNPTLHLKKPIPVRLEPFGTGWLVTWVPVELYADGETEDAAVNNFKHELIAYYCNLRESPHKQLPKLPATHLNHIKSYIEEIRRPR
jgi:hypothetical protein